MTPLMLASILNNFPVVQCLLLRGHSFQIPHFLTCECDICKRQTVNNRSSTRLVDVMRAVSSEAYLWLATDDVSAAACSVAHDLQTLISEDCLEHVEIYRHLEANVQRFLARISDQAWRSEEFNVLVANKNYCARRSTELSSPRLMMAMDSEMRQFTCSTNAQTTIKSVFRGDWLNFGNKPRRDAWRLLRSSFLMPFLVFLHAAVPNQGTTMSVPLARYISHVSMYILFLISAILRPTIVFYPNWNHSGYIMSIRVLEGFMYTYILGLLLEKSLLFYRVGKDAFFAFWWRWFDVVLIFSFLLSFIFFIGTISWRENFNPLLIDRMHWPSGEFALLHEIFLSISCVLGISKMFYYIQMIKGVGGSVISIGKCVGKTYTYLLIMVAIIVSFSVGLNILVSPYLNRRSIKTDKSGPDTITTQSYDSIGTSSKNLFWSIFGYLGPSTYITVVGNTGENMDPVSHNLNSATLEILGALYHGIIIITVLNLMTSLLVKKADEVLDNEEMEFKYTRAAMYTEFISWEMAAPPPLNLILVPAHTIHRLPFFQKYKSPSWGSKPTYDDDDNVGFQMNLTEQYKKLLVVIFNRFCASKECKYKTIWRTEFDKDEKQPNHVSFLSTGPHLYPMDNTFEGWRKRESRNIKVPEYDKFEVYRKPVTQNPTNPAPTKRITSTQQPDPKAVAKGIPPV
uniref:Ion_trans domain-containing protein n=1 Tax=Caenorhabditis tropicalis TaxID=1561998 RepID=A0A1I7UHT3_9PELO